MSFDPPKPPTSGAAPEDEFNDDDDGVFYRRLAREMRERKPSREPREPREETGPARDSLGRFEKGQTGNPLGRKPKIKYAKTDPSIFFATLIEVTRNGKTEKVTREEAFLQMLFTQALAGKVSAMRMIEKKIEAWHARQTEIQDFFRYLMDKHSGPYAVPWTPQELRLRDQIMEAMSLGMDSTSRMRNMDHARSARRRRLKERKATEAEAAAMEEKWEAKRAARRMRDAARRAAKKSGGSDGGEA